MSLEHYALGNNFTRYWRPFCHTLEKALDDLGRTIGATSFKS